MVRKIILTVGMGVLLSGCFMAPLALIGPATSGFTTASLVQSGATTGINYLVKKSTGKTISQHAFDTINIDVLQQSYFPNRKNIIVTKKTQHH